MDKVIEVMNQGTLIEKINLCDLKIKKRKILIEKLILRNRRLRELKKLLAKSETEQLLEYKNEIKSNNLRKSK